MKRKALLFILLLALGLPWAAQAQETPKAITATLPWSEDFESYIQRTRYTPLSSEWATPATYDGKPCVLISDTWLSPVGRNSLECMTNGSNSNIFVLPKFNKPLNTLTVQFKVAGHTRGRGQFGYITDANDASTFHSLTNISQPVTAGNHNYSSYNYDLSTMSAPTNSSYRLAVKYTFFGSDDEEGSWYFDDFSVTYTDPSGGGDVCTPFFSGVSDYITNFTLGDINNSTGLSTNGYGDYTLMSTTLTIGAQVSASLSSSDGGGYHGAAIWIDFNNDGTFDSSTERVGTYSNSITPNSTVSINVSIPYYATTGSHLMRVMYHYNMSGDELDPCTPTNIHGECEDYMVNIIAELPNLPYTEDFENNQNGWQFVNGTRTNKWYYGAAGAHDSNNGLFISYNGIDNQYNNTAAGAVWAYREINFGETKDYVISFDWKAYGEDRFDYIRVGLVPSTTTLTDGDSFEAPTGWIDLNDNTILNQQSSWQRKTTTINVSAGTYKLAFCWRNDNSSGSNPPAAIDNVDVRVAPTHTITVTANPSAGGTVSGGGTIAESNTCTLVATPNPGYNFVNWTENGTEVSTDASYMFIVECDHNLVANFEAWTVSIASEPASTECLTPGTEVVLTASNNVLLQNLGEYAFSTGIDASKWYNLNSYTDISVSEGDHGVSSLQNIGFTFTFGGTQYTQFSVNSDGNLRLGETVTGTGSYTSPFSSSNANNNNPKINGMGFDGYFVASINHVRKQVFGEAPNRVLVVEFNESPCEEGYRYNTWNWQVQLSENGTIQIVYGNTAPSRYYYNNQIGLCVNANDGWTVSTTTHEATHFTEGTTATNTPATSWPGNSRYYCFSPGTYAWNYTGTPGTANGNVYTVTPTENSTYTVSFTCKGTTLTETVEVTMQALTKTIAAYSNSQAEKGGYYLIASPLAADVNPATVGMITDELGSSATTSNGTYDLYSFDQAAALEWQNYRASNFNLVNGTGYLYASKNGTTLTFSGAPYSGDTKTVTLHKTAAATGLDFPAWNLVGNPFAVDDAYITKSFYTLENSDTYTLNTAVTAIHPMQGLFVVAVDDNEPLTFSTEAPAGKVASLHMNVSKVATRGVSAGSTNVIDQAIISFTEGQELPKLQFRNGSTKVYLPKDGKEYAIVSAESVGTMPVNFKAEDNGRYTLTFTTEEVSFGYLHLIDNLTGNDVDLLATPSYSFNAKSTDYESRFKLVFATGNASDDNFAFYSNGSFVINNEGNATLQVIDVNGRILKSESINGCANLNVNAASGVYMIRLVSGDSVKVQKVVMR